jgi:uncharacterized DUF497 family protein
VLYEWDLKKAAANLQKHKVSFLEATTVFLDPLAMTFDDPDHSAAERRFITIGWSQAGRLLLVAHADRRDRIRLVSARRATRRETHDYEEGTFDAPG